MGSGLVVARLAPGLASELWTLAGLRTLSQAGHKIRSAISAASPIVATFVAGDSPGPAD